LRKGLHVPRNLQEVSAAAAAEECVGSLGGIPAAQPRKGGADRGELLGRVHTLKIANAQAQGGERLKGALSGLADSAHGLLEIEEHR
jgi:hypothetical protein